MNAQNQIQYLQPKPLKIGHHHTAPQGVSALQVANNAVPPDSWSAVRGTGQYTHGETSFGRLGVEFPPELAMAVQQMLSALNGNSIPKMLNVHDNFIRIFQMLGPCDLSHTSNNVNVLAWLTTTKRPTSPIETQTFDATQQHWFDASASWRRFQRLKKLFRPDEIFGESPTAKYERARTEKENKNITANTYPGLLSAQHLSPSSEIGACWERIERDWFDGRTLPVETEPRKRGIEKFEGTFAESSPFFKKMQENNLFCSAGLSGSTTTLLLAASFFAEIDNQLEDAQIYLLAIIGYLVGGGMHSCHEIFETAERIGIPYTVGKYEQSLPNVLKNHPLYTRWKSEFGDVVL
ncbi:hypothetical protein [Methylosinus sp. LW4]|uniref:hypothetical protein n=1 Tax=Methylosinus sp. LW4 TaxID=136993 RepID=UPI0012F7B2BF|nr:hypothetical protein [Methylosinus sp. LW4]